MLPQKIEKFREKPQNGYQTWEILALKKDGKNYLQILDDRRVYLILLYKCAEDKNLMSLSTKNLDSCL